MGTFSRSKASNRPNRLKLRRLALGLEERDLAALRSALVPRYAKGNPLTSAQRCDRCGREVLPAVVLCLEDEEPHADPAVHCRLVRAAERLAALARVAQLRGVDDRAHCGAVACQRGLVEEADHVPDLCPVGARRAGGRPGALRPPR